MEDHKEEIKEAEVAVVPPKTEFELINEELSKFSWKTKRKFEELFPCKKPVHLLEVGCKEYAKEQKYIRAAKLALGEKYTPMTEHYTIEYLRFESTEQFWSDWKKFRKYWAFL